MQSNKMIKIIIDKRKLDTLIRLGISDENLLMILKTQRYVPTGDELIDDYLSTLFIVKEFSNWGGNRENSGRKPKNNQLENQDDNQDDNQLENQDDCNLDDKDKDKDIDIYRKKEISKEKKNFENTEKNAERAAAEEAFFKEFTPEAPVNAPSVPTTPLKEKKSKTSNTLDYSFIENPQIQTMLKDFAENRKALKKPVTQRALELLHKRLMALAGGKIAKAQAIVDYSIEKNWLTFYELPADVEKLANQRPNDLEVFKKMGIDPRLPRSICE